MASIFNVRVEIGKRRATQILTNLRSIASPAFLESLKIDAIADKALKYLKVRFPKSKAGTRTEGSRAETGTTHLREGWFVLPDFTAKGVGFGINHILAGDKRIQTILKSLDAGHKAYSFTPDRTLGFKDLRARNKVSILRKGVEVNRPSEPAVEYVDDTFRYVLTVLIPALRLKAKSRAKNLIEKK